MKHHKTPRWSAVAKELGHLFGVVPRPRSGRTHSWWGAKDLQEIATVAFRRRNEMILKILKILRGPAQESEPSSWLSGSPS